MPKAKTPRSPRSKQVSEPANSNVTVMSESAAAAAPALAPVSENKSEPKKMALPIPINVEEEIRRRAYEIFQQRGDAPGSEHDDWAVAEREILARYQQQSA
jgi:hypothetical protein